MGSAPPPCPGQWWWRVWGVAITFSRRRSARPASRAESQPQGRRGAAGHGGGRGGNPCVPCGGRCGPRHASRAGATAPEPPPIVGPVGCKQGGSVPGWGGPRVARGLQATPPRAGPRAHNSNAPGLCLPGVGMGSRRTLALGRCARHPGSLSDFGGATATGRHGAVRRGTCTAAAPLAAPGRLAGVCAGVSGGGHPRAQQEVAAAMRSPLGCRPGSPLTTARRCASGSAASKARQATAGAPGSAHGHFVQLTCKRHAGWAVPSPVFSAPARQVARRRRVWPATPKNKTVKAPLAQHGQFPAQTKPRKLSEGPRRFVRPRQRRTRTPSRTPVLRRPLLLLAPGSVFRSVR